MSLWKAWRLMRFYQRQGCVASLLMVKWNQWAVLALLSAEGAERYFGYIERGEVPPGAPPIRGFMARLEGVPLLIMGVE